MNVEWAMAGYFSQLFDLPGRGSFFGPQEDAEDAPSDDGMAGPPWIHRPFFSWKPGQFFLPFSAPATLPGSLAPAMERTRSVRSDAVTPVVANFGPLGGSGKQANRPYWKDIPIYPRADPRMPFFVLPPNAIFNMPVYKWERAPLRVPPWVDQEGHPHLDLINPDYDQLVTPGKDS